MPEFDNDHLRGLRAALLDLFTRRLLPLPISGASWKITFSRSGISCTAEAASAGLDVHKGAVVPGRRCEGRTPDQ